MTASPNVKQTWSTSIKNDSGAAVVTDAPVVITGDAEVNWGVQVPVGETTEVDADILVAKIVSGFISSNQNIDVFTNAADGSGGQHLVITAGRAVGWHNLMSTANPFTPNITKFFIKNNGTAIATVRAGFLLQE